MCIFFCYHFSRASTGFHICCDYLHRSFLTLFISAKIYNLVLEKTDNSQWEATSQLGMSNKIFSRTAACGTWLGDFVTMMMVIDMFVPIFFSVYFVHKILAPQDAARQRTVSANLGVSPRVVDKATTKPHFEFLGRNLHVWCCCHRLHCLTRRELAIGQWRAFHLQRAFSCIRCSDDYLNGPRNRNAGFKIQDIGFCWRRRRPAYENLSCRTGTFRPSRAT